MKKFLLLAVACLSCVLISNIAFAITLNVDAAPNGYGSPGFPSWQQAAFAAAASGSFINMEHSKNPNNIGTTNFEIEDDVVYSFGDLGYRLHCVYYIPGETIESLIGNFTVHIDSYWGNDPVYDVYAVAGWGSWVQPTSWVNYDSNGDGQTDGVAGSFGNAWWGAYGVDTQAALDADIAAWRTIGETFVFQVNYKGTVETLTAYRAPVPEPTTLLLLGLGLLGVAGVSRKKN